MNFAKLPATKISPGMDRFADQRPRANPGIERRVDPSMNKFIDQRPRANPGMINKVLPFIPAVQGPSISDLLKPKFYINSLDKQNNLDRTQSIGDYKPIPAATFNGAVLGKVLQ